MMMMMMMIMMMMKMNIYTLLLLKGTSSEAWKTFKYNSVSEIGEGKNGRVVSRSHVRVVGNVVVKK
jgi:hypothetical protein